MERMNVLSEHERLFIVAASLSADATTKDLAQALGMKEHKVRYIRESLIEREIIKPLFQLNYFAMGLNDFGIYLSRGSENSTARKKFEDLMGQFSSVFWIAKTGGAYQYAVSFVTANPYELDDLFSATRPSESGAHFEKSFGLRLDWAIFPPTYLIGNTRKRPCVFMTAKDEVHQLDDTDRTLLRILSTHPSKSSAEITRMAGLNASSVAYRIGQLRKKGIIRMQRYMLNMEKLGFSGSRLTIVDRGLTPQQRVELAHTCARHPNVVAFLRCTGDWDYELRLEAESPQLVDTFCQLLFDTFGNAIGSIKSFQQLKVLKHVAFPW